MRSLSLEIACFDFVVDGGGDYSFLELNQQGQFLWVEESAPQVRMLGAFVEFLIRKGGSSTGMEEVDSLSIKRVTSTPLYTRSFENFQEYKVIDMGEVA